MVPGSSRHRAQRTHRAEAWSRTTHPIWKNIFPAIEYIQEHQYLVVSLQAHSDMGKSQAKLTWKSKTGRETPFEQMQD